MTPTPDFTAMTEAFTNTWTLGTQWLIPLAVAIMAMAFITRDIGRWKILALPIFVGERIIGMPVHFILLLVSAIMFVVETLSTQLIGNILGGLKQYTEKGESNIERDENILRKFERAKSHEAKLSAIPLTEVKNIFGKRRFKKELKNRSKDDVIINKNIGNADWFGMTKKEREKYTRNYMGGNLTEKEKVVYKKGNIKKNGKSK